MVDSVFFSKARNWKYFSQPVWKKYGIHRFSILAIHKHPTLRTWVVAITENPYSSKMGPIYIRIWVQKWTHVVQKFFERSQCQCHGQTFWRHMVCRIFLLGSTLWNRTLRFCFGTEFWVKLGFKHWTFKKVQCWTFLGSISIPVHWTSKGSIWNCLF